MPGDIRKFFEPAGPAAKKKQEEVELAPGGDTRKCSQSISHAQKPRDRHQNQVCSMLWTQVTILANSDLAKIPKMAILATQVNLGCLEMVSIDFPCPNPLA